MSEEKLDGMKRGPIVGVLLIGAFIAILNETLLNTALPHIMQAFNITQNTVQWLTTAFLLTNGVMIPITAFLFKRFSTRWLFITSMVAFAIGTLIAGISQSFSLLLIGRIVQAAGSGVMMPLMMNVFLAIFPPKQRGAAMGLAGLVITFAPAIGPSLSGWLVEHHSWRVLFYVVLPIAVLDIIFALFFMKDVLKLTRPKIDSLSILLSTIGFGGLLYGFSSAGNDGWSSTKVVVSIIVGGVVLLMFIWRQLIMKTPLLEFRVFKNGTFTLTLILGMFVFMSLIGAETILPMYMQNMRAFTSFKSGLMLLPGAIIMGIMSPFIGMLFDKFGARVLVISGLTIMGIGTLPFMFLSASTSYTFLMVIYAIRMFGMSFAMMPLMTAGLNQLPQDLHPHATAMLNTMQQVAGSIGTAILFTVMSNATKHQIENSTMGKPTPALIQHAQIHGANVAFLIVLILAVIGIFISFFLKNKKPLEEDAYEGQTQPLSDH